MALVTRQDVEEVRASLARTPPAHPKVANVGIGAESFMAAARFQQENGNPVDALRLASVAEGIAMALEAVAGVTEGIRERQILREASALRVELQLAELKTRMH